MGPQTICHVIVKEKVAEQIILGKYCNCNSFGVTMDLLNSQNLLKVGNIAITHLSSGLSPQNPQKIKGCENSLGQLIDKKICSCSSFREICATH